MSFVRETILRLKNRWPVAVDLYKTISRVPNLETGEDVVEMRKVTIRKAILLPPSLSMQLTQAQIGGATPFGGFLPADTTQFLVDGRDVPKDFVIDNEDCHMIVSGMKWEIFKVQDYMMREAFILTTKALPGTNFVQLLDRNWDDDLGFGDLYE